MTPRPSDLPTVRPGLVERAIGWVRQLLSPLDREIGFASGGIGAAPDYSALKALSAMAAFPWIRTCAEAKCTDVAGVPLVAVRGGNETLPLEGRHPFLDLIRRPSPGVTETVLRRQLVLDFEIAQNAYLWLRKVPDGWELHRLHPEHVRIVRGRDGVQAGWLYRGKPLSLLDVWHVPGLSWQDDHNGLFGEPITRPLGEGLLAVRSARRHATKQAEQGRPDLFITLPENAGAGPTVAKGIRDGYAESMREGHKVYVVGGGAKAEPVTWSPADLQFAELDIRVRDETIALMGVPPTRAGIPQANYAVAKAELRQYWQSLSTGVMRLLEDAYTAIARIVGEDLDVVIKHDLSSVEALQASYDQRQARAGFWVHSMGGTPELAARFEGFRGAPVGKVSGAGEQDAKRPAVEVDDQPNRQAIPRAIGAYLALAAERLQGGGGGPAAETFRLAGMLEIVGVASDEAVAFAEGVVPLLIETAETQQDADLTELYVFSQAHAERVSRQLAAPRLALAAK